MTRKADDRRFNFFYLDPSPAAAAAIVEDYLASLPELVADSRSDDPQKRFNAAHGISTQSTFLVYAAMGRPDIVRVYEGFVRDRFAEATMLLPILRDVGDEQTDALMRELAGREPEFAAMIDQLLERPRGSVAIDDPQRPIEQIADLDPRWMRFFATGDTAPVAELLQLLAWPDHVRAHLEAHLKPQTGLMAWISGRRARQAETLRGLEALGLRFDPATHAVLNRDDLDRFIMMTGVVQDVERFKSFHAVLPAPIPEGPLTRAAMKSSATWSLAANAAEHPVVIALCEQHMGRFEGAARLGVLAILAAAYAKRGEFAAAHRVTARHLELDPDRADLREPLAKFAVEAQFAGLRALAGDRVEEDVTSSLVTDALARCAARFAGVATYHARVFLEIHGDDWLRSQYRARFAGRDREHVVLGRWNREHDGLGDEWIRIGRRCYVNPGIWARLPRDMGDDMRAAEYVRVDTYVAIAAAAAPHRSARIAGTPYLALHCEVPALAGIDPGHCPGPHAVELWIDPETGWLAHAHATPVAGSSFEVDAWFIAADPPFKIEAPAGALEPK